MSFVKDDPLRDYGQQGIFILSNPMTHLPWHVKQSLAKFLFLLARPFALRSSRIGELTRDSLSTSGKPGGPDK